MIGVGVAVAVVAGAFAAEAAPDLFGIVAGLASALASLWLLAMAARGG